MACSIDEQARQQWWRAPHIYANLVSLHLSTDRTTSADEFLYCGKRKLDNHAQRKAIGTQPWHHASAQSQEMIGSGKSNEGTPQRPHNISRSEKYADVRGG